MAQADIGSCLVHAEPASPGLQHLLGRSTARSTASTCCAGTTSVACRSNRLAVRARLPAGLSHHVWAARSEPHQNALSRLGWRHSAGIDFAHLRFVPAKRRHRGVSAIFLGIPGVTNYMVPPASSGMVRTIHRLIALLRSRFTARLAGSPSGSPHHRVAYCRDSIGNLHAYRSPARDLAKRRFTTARRGDRRSAVAPCCDAHARPAEVLITCAADSSIRNTTAVLCRFVENRCRLHRCTLADNYFCPAVIDSMVATRLSVALSISSRTPSTRLSATSPDASHGVRSRWACATYSTHQAQQW